MKLYSRRDSTPDLLHKLVHAMDRSADVILQKQFGITYKRAYFLLVLQRVGTVTQHQLAVVLGYSAASVSTMLTALSKLGYVDIQPSPHHGRKKLVSLTPYGKELVTKGRNMLNAHFASLMLGEHMNIQEYYAQTERLYSAVVAKNKEQK
ncbi:MAG: MarR family transcriptional regulator [Candidatus Doudnabacteria bacterium]|nr:MarR family transcriptional regulator [Candidatus Doudnabacteria bacterium]